MKINKLSPDNKSGKAPTVLTVFAVFLIVAGAGVLIFSLLCYNRFFEPETKSAETGIYEEIPENAKPVRKDTEEVASSYEQSTDLPAAKLIDVPYINQRKKYPTGCESVSAVMALMYAGYDITPEDFIDNYLPKSPAPYIDDSGKLFGYNPYRFFIGDPYSADGWGCYYPVIGRCISRIIDKDRHRVVRIRNASMSALTSYTDRDIPVIIWATQGMNEAKRSQSWILKNSERKFTWVTPNHCLLLVGYDDTGYYFNDPLTHKNCRYPADIVKKRYVSMGSQALAIIPKTGADPDVRANK